MWYLNRGLVRIKTQILNKQCTTQPIAYCFFSIFKPFLALLNICATPNVWPQPYLGLFINQHKQDELWR